MIRGCVSMIGLAVLVVAALVAGWFERDAIREYVSRFLDREKAGVEVVASGEPAEARRAEEKIIALGQGEVDEVTLSAEELDGWIRSGLKGFFPGYISDVRASIGDEQLRLAGRVATDSISGLDRLGPASLFIPDTADVSVAGRLDGLEPGRGVFWVETIRIGALPLPDAIRDQIMLELKGGRAGELGANAVEFELPRFVTDIGVRGEHIFLRSSRRDR